ncbi:MAG: aminotransferase class I/II-fold pyridoxal phosphate-dependent enzyme [bacterium]|nr:aminotransferase class I/II-fold pyridoxal phosphate-dependent enzyme [bacterium]
MNKQSNNEIINPFARLRELLGDARPGIEPAIDMTIGAPQHAFPPFIKQVLADKHELYIKYPPIRAIPVLADAIGGWIEQRYELAGHIDRDRMLLPVMGSREGLFSAVFTARDMKPGHNRAALIPNPFYQVYASGALAAQLEPVYLEAPQENGYLPDLDKLEENAALLERTSVLFLCSPSNPQGAIAPKAYLQQAISLARANNFMIFADECYSEIYFDEKPTGILQAAYLMSGDFSKVAAFNSLSKRSNLPGLRSGFVAGDPQFIEKYACFRNVSCPQMPLPVQYASAKIWADEPHVEENRVLYAHKMELAEKILKNHILFQKPGGGFFLWIKMSDLGGGERATERIWKGCGVKMLPGAYLAKEDLGAPKGANPAHNDVRIALVHDLETTRSALERIVSVI